MTKHIALYGKGGVGKSTLSSNLSAALAEAGFSVLLVGCDPKGDSCSLLNNGTPIPTVFDLLREQGDISVNSVVHEGFKGITCVELGDPFDSGSCGSDEITRALGHLKRIDLFEAVAPDFVLYDISGDSPCSSFYTPIQQLGVSRVFVVTTADFMSLHAANAIFRMLERYGESNVPVPVGGLIPNSINSSFEESFIADFAAQTRTQTMGRIPRSLIVRQCELYGKTVIEASPLSNQSYFYRRLANQIVDDDQAGVPVPMRPEELRAWARGWGDRIHALENGLVTDGAAI
ncbi:MAG: P-loop NTPase [Oryzomonas sp.]|uniref:nucleotide-binding protein n=1 Tax=Oryzomonas sp. TaxID=2855186 RepID=UPI0028452755|nr:P-loop NTPase [Oryzomonas sp.]MDR3579796.1 P-loop NTPase [Oryzomonas sp.]